MKLASIGNRTWIRVAGLAVLFGVGVLAAANHGDHTATAADICSDAGLQNPGFEAASSAANATAAEPIPCWDRVAPDSVTVVGSETVPFKGGGTVTVVPKTGSQMVRLGTPKLSNQKQNRGENQVKQVFTPTSGTLKFAVRLLSWEHRGNDVFKIALQNPSTNANIAGLTLTMSPASIVSCTALPCSKTIDVGNSGDFVDTNWVTVTIGNVPTTGNVRLIVGAGGTANESTATWLYVDSVNLPPVADFGCAYARVDLGVGVVDPNLAATPANSDCRFAASTDGAGPLEGTPVQLNDASTDPDGPADIVAWDWTVTGPGLFEATGQSELKFNLRKPFILPPQDGTFTIKLKVTDSGGLTSAEKTRTLVVVNAPPLVNALNIEYLAGQPASVLGRFSDSGWLDTHTATVDGASATVQDDNSAALASGLATANVSGFVGTGAHTLAVTDSVGATRSDSFTATSVVDNPARHEPNDSFTLPAPPEANVDSAILSYLQSATDRDVFEVRWPGSPSGDQDIPAGAEILATLRGLPADYDLVLVAVAPPTTGFSQTGFSQTGFSQTGFSQTELPSLVNPFAAGYSQTGFSQTGFSQTALERSAYFEAGFSQTGFSQTGFSQTGFSQTGYSMTDATFAPYAITGFSMTPISQAAFTGIDSAAINNTDISAAELALGQLPAGAQIVGFSARHGTASEVVTARIDFPGTKLYAVVIGSNGAYSTTAPYTLQLEGSMSFVTAALASGNTALLGGFCPDSNISSDTPLAFNVGAGAANPKTLILTNLDRMKNVTPADPAWALTGGDPIIVERLKAYAADPAVAGKIINLSAVPAVQAAYLALDALPCDVQKANIVTDTIRDVVDAQIALYPGIEYVVIAGDDDVVPFRRVPDETTISNERYYLGSAYLKPGTPLFASVQQGFNLSDDFYVDESPTPWQGRALYIPDRVIARLVETPTEIGGQVTAFLGSPGRSLDVSAQEAAFVAGYDFFTDGSNVVAQNLASTVGGAAEVRTLISDTWTKDQLACQLLGEPLAACSVDSLATINNPNAHFTHYAGLSAAGFTNKNYSDYLTSTAVKTALGGSGLQRKLLMTIGCHAGFSAPDGSTLDADPIFGFNAKLDFAQAVALQRGVLIASTGFGLGETEGLGGTEMLLTLLADTLAGKTTGQALLAAKIRYLTEQANPSVYDEKSSIQVIHYGIPQYASGFAGTGQAAGQVAAQVADPSATYLYPSLASGLGTATVFGNYFSLPPLEGDGADGAPYRPLQPRDIVALPLTADGPVHGVIINTATYRDIPGFNPVISRPTVEWEVTPQEPQVCGDAFTPSSILRVNSLETAGVLQQTLVVTPGQFECDTDAYGDSGEVTGTERLFPSVSLQTLRSNSADFTSPGVAAIDLRKLAGGNIELTLTANDTGTGLAAASGLGRIVVLRIGGTALTTAADVSAPTSGQNPWTAKIVFGTADSDGINAGDGLIIQVADVAGNVTWYTGKGKAIRFIDFEAGAGPVVTPTNTVTFTTTLSALTVGQIIQPAFYLWTFGDGLSAAGPLVCAPAVDCVLSVTHTFAAGSEFTASLRIFDADGGIGTDDVYVRVCTDPPGDQGGPDAFRDLIACSVTSTPTTIEITIVTRGPVLIGGVPADSTTQYRIYFDNGDGGAFVERMKWRNGAFSGLALASSSVTNSGTGSAITFVFNRSAVGTGPLRFFAEVQDGLRGVPGAGIIDLLPNTGGIYIIQP